MKTHKSKFSHTLKSCGSDFVKRRYRTFFVEKRHSSGFFCEKFHNFVAY